MASHGEPGNNQNRRDADWRLLAASESEDSSDFNSDEEAQAQAPSDIENQYSENDENSYNIAQLMATRFEAQQERRQILGLIPIFDALNSQDFIMDDNFHNVFPHLFWAITTIRAQQEREGKVWFQEVKIPHDCLVLLEEAMEFLLGQTKPEGPYDSDEKAEALCNYMNLRKEVLIGAAKEYHEGNESRPGYDHSLGHLFPTKTSFEMIEYFRVAFAKLGNPLPMKTSDSGVFYPELDEYNGVTRTMIQQCISNHKTLEMREEIIALVETKTHLSKNNKETINNLISEMNLMFNRNLEYNVIREAEEQRNKQRKEMLKLERAQRQREMQARNARRARPRNPKVEPPVQVQAPVAQQYVEENIPSSSFEQSTRYTFDEQEPSTSASPLTYIQL